MEQNAFAPTILKWFSENGRELPWRQTRDPYAIWLSEIILQQTRTEQGRPYWERFLRRWPTVEALAAATEDEVLREWQGLGYYSRARNLHAAASQIVHLGAFPATIEGLRSLKGVGDYTAAAIGSIAFGLPAAVVDGNVYRVLARHYGISTPINTTEGKKEFTALAQSLLPVRQASAYNQAMMDFGATLCTPSSPRCEACPLMETCTAFREGRVGDYPVKQKTLKVKERRLTYVYIRFQGETAIHRRPAGDIWQGLYEPLLMDRSNLFALLAKNGQLIMDNYFAQPNFPLSIINFQLLASQVKHVLTHRVLYADFYLWEPAERPALPADYFWIPEADIDNYAVPRLIEILLDNLAKRSRSQL